jgi:hypothetical protein
MSGKIFLLAGRERKVMEFSEETGTAREIGELPFKNGTSLVISTTALHDGKDDVWLFAANYARPTNPILLFNTTTKNVHSSSANTSSFLSLYFAPAPVLTHGKFPASKFNHLRLKFKLELNSWILLVQTNSSSTQRFDYLKQSNSNELKALIISVDRLLEIFVILRISFDTPLPMTK